MAFNYKATFTVQTSQMPSSQTDFPFAINWTDNTFKTVGNGGQVTSSSGFDIRPYSDSSLTTPLTFQLIFYDGSAGTIYMRVQNTMGVGGIIYLGIGDAGITTDGSSDSTWSASYLGAWPFPNGSSLDLTDYSSTNNGTGVNSPTATTGKFDGGLGLASASSQYVNVGTGIDPIAVTVMAWVKATSFPNAYNVVVWKQPAPSSTFIGLAVKSTGKLFAGIAANSFISYDGTGINTLSTATFYHLALTYSAAAGLTVYVNGSSDNAIAGNGDNVTGNGGDVTFGEDTLTTGRFWNGTLDEMQIRSVASTSDWVTTEYNLGDQASFWGTPSFTALGGSATLMGQVLT